MDDYKFLKINGAKTKYTDSGEGLPIIFVHAGIADSRMWNDQIAEFSKAYRVITYDMRGYGMSPPASEEYKPHEDLIALMDALAVERCVLVGCSKGGGIIMDTALAAPSRVAGLVVVAGIAHGLELDEDAFEEPEIWDEYVKAYKQGDIESVNEFEVQMFVDGFNQPVGRGPSDVREKVRMMNAIALKNEADAKSKVLEPKAGTRLGEIQVPLLFITGELDEPVVRLAVEDMMPQIPQAEHKEIKGAAHLPNMEAPKKFNQIVLDFIREI